MNKLLADASAQADHDRRGDSKRIRKFEPLL